MSLRNNSISPLTQMRKQWTLPVCTGMYVQVCMYRYVYMYVRTCMYVHACMYMYVNTRTGMHMNVCGCVRTGMKVYKHKLHTLLGIALHIHTRNTDIWREGQSPITGELQCKPVYQRDGVLKKLLGC